jgi:hypothetical protein
MKNTGICPKCSSNNISCHPGITGGNFHGFRLCLLVSESFFGPTVADVKHYVCLDCGFVEQWVNTDLDLRKLRRAKESKQIKKSG